MSTPIWGSNDDDLRLEPGKVGPGKELTFRRVLAGGKPEVDGLSLDALLAAARSDSVRIYWQNPEPLPMHLWNRVFQVSSPETAPENEDGLPRAGQSAPEESVRLVGLIRRDSLR